jgi:NAD(P)H dehydrogenase (quinone)
LRTVPKVSAVCTASEPQVPVAGAPYVEAADLEQCIGLALGSPTRFGNMAAPMKFFWDSTASQWSAGALAGKPACVFTSTASAHGGQESTLLSMMLPLLHHGMLLVGLPYTETALSCTRSGALPMAPAIWPAEGESDTHDDERQLAFAQGRRLATIALKLAADDPQPLSGSLQQPDCADFPVSCLGTAPGAVQPGGSWLALKCLPLLLPLFGILNGRRYTYQWASMLILLYFTEGIVRATTEHGTAQALAIARPPFR